MLRISLLLDDSLNERAKQVVLAHFQTSNLDYLGFQGGSNHYGNFGVKEPYYRIEIIRSGGGFNTSVRSVINGEVSSGYVENTHLLASDLRAKLQIRVDRDKVLRTLRANRSKEVARKDRLMIAVED